jgi:hypothetical protein
MKPKSKIPVAQEVVTTKVHFIRGELVVLDSDLANFFGVPTKALNQAVSRNQARFPVDFMFQLTKEEVEILRSQNVTANKSHGGRRNFPYAFTEIGCWTISLILTSAKAKSVGIELMRTFKAMKDHLKEHPKSLSGKVQKALSTPGATINLYDSPNSIIILNSETTNLQQTVSSTNDLIKTLKALMPLLQKDEAPVAQAVEELVAVLKTKDKGRISQAVSTVSDLVSISTGAGPALVALKGLLATLGAWYLS